MSRGKQFAIIAASVIAIAALAAHVREGGSARPRVAQTKAPFSARAAAQVASDMTAPGAFVDRSAGDIDAADPTGTLLLEGLVLGVDDEPVANARVKLDSIPARVVTTDEHGAFTFAGLLRRRYSLVAASDKGLAGPLYVTMSDRKEPLVLRLRAAASVQLSVIDGSGAPVEGAEVELESDLVSRWVTDEKGTVTMAPVWPGTWGLRANKAGFAPAARFVTVGTDGVARAELRLEPGAPLAGRVVDQNGAPLASVRVWPEPAGEIASPVAGESAAIVTDGNGRFQFPALAPMAYRLHASAAQRPRATSGIVVLPATGLEDVEIRIPDGAELRGRVLGTGGTGEPARVRIEIVRTGQRYQMYTRDDGTFAIGALPREELRVHADAGAVASEVTRVDLSTGDASIELALVHAARIAGVVVDPFGEPVMGAQVLTWSQRGERHWRDLTDAAGRFELHAVAPGEYVLMAGRDTAIVRGMTADLPRQTVAAGRDDVRFVLPADGAITGEVMTSDGTRLSSYRVRVPRTPPVPFAAPRFTLGDLPPGTYTLWLEGGAFAARRIDGVVVRSGATTDLGQIEVARGRSISGRVVTPSGAPVAGAQIRSGAAIMGSGAQANLDGVEPGFTGAAQVATTDATGAFVLVGVSPGPTSIIADAGDRGRAPPVVLPATAESVAGVVLVVDMVASLTGTVTVNERPGPALVNAQPHASPLAMAAVPAGDDGGFRFDRMAPGRYTVAVLVGNPMNGGSFHPHHVEVPAGETVTLVLSARTGNGSMEIKVTGSLVAAVFATSVPLRATNALELVHALGRQGGGQWAMAPALGGPASLSGLVGGRWTVCAMVPPLSARDLSSMLSSIAREGESMPVRCTEVEVSDGVTGRTSIDLAP